MHTAIIIIIIYVSHIKIPTIPIQLPSPILFHPAIAQNILFLLQALQFRSQPPLGPEGGQREVHQVPVPVQHDDIREKRRQ